MQKGDSEQSAYQKVTRIEKIEVVQPSLQGIQAYFQDNSGKTSSFLLKKDMRRWYSYSLKSQIVFVVFGDTSISNAI